jgi:hypothetical protein
VGFQICSRLVEHIVKFQVQMMRLQILHKEYGRNGPRKLAESVKDVLGLQIDAFTEPVVVLLSRSTHSVILYVMAGRPCPPPPHCSPQNRMMAF